MFYCFNQKEGLIPPQLAAQQTNTDQSEVGLMGYPAACGEVIHSAIIIQYFNQFDFDDERIDENQDKRDRFDNKINEKILKKHLTKKINSI